MSVEKVRQLVAEKKVVMFGKITCPFCMEAKKILRDLDIPFNEVITDSQGSLFDSVKLVSGQKTVPNIYIGGVHIGGCEDLKTKIKNGQVIKALEDAGVCSKLSKKEEIFDEGVDIRSSKKIYD